MEVEVNERHAGLFSTVAAGPVGAAAVSPSGHAAWEDRSVKRLALLTGCLALAACGGEDGERSAATPPATATATATAEPAAESTKAAPARKGTRIVAGDSQFGSMLFNGGQQAIYVFERDANGKSACYGECAEAWPPVLTKGEPAAGVGVKAALLGSIPRRDGGRQVTYAGQPLYYYAHEGPGQVLCHNVQLNGGLWWVVAPGGKHRT
jgi:predicted lipoprotein with Yx(FWY)xxD motif